MSARRLPLAVVALVLALVATSTACTPKEGSDKAPGVPQGGAEASAVGGGDDAPVGGGSGEAGGGRAPVIAVRDGDPEIQAAIDEAQRTLDQFIAALARPRSRSTSMTIKAAIPTSAGPDGPHHEHIWVDSVRYESGTFHGKLANEPEYLPGKKMGDDVTVARANVSDWMIVEGDDVEHMKGGYTVKVLLARQKR